MGPGWIGLFALLAVAAFWVLAVEPNWFRLRHKTVRLAKPLRRPLTLLHLSDLHFKRNRFFLSRFFDSLARLPVDFVFVTGDLIDASGGIEPCVKNLKKLKPRKGTYAVLGNHDYRVYSLWDTFQWFFTRRGMNSPRPNEETERLKQSLREAGVRLLANENIAVPLSEGEETIVIGIDDPVTGRADLNQALRGIEDGLLHLALSHSPKVFPLLGRRGIDIAFAGHTHGGQVRLPGIGPLPLARLISPIIDSTDQFGFVGLISRGLGAQSPAFRFLCRPEAILVRLEGRDG